MESMEELHGTTAQVEETNDWTLRHHSTNQAFIQEQLKLLDVAQKKETIAALEGRKSAHGKLNKSKYWKETS